MPRATSPPLRPRPQLTTEQQILYEHVVCHETLAPTASVRNQAQRGKHRCIHTDRERTVRSDGEG